MNGFDHKLWASVLYVALWFLLRMPEFGVFPLILVIPVAFGAHFPDFDLDLRPILSHRSVLTHSFIIPALLTALYFTNIDKTALQVLTCFLIGYSSHLLLDIFPSKKSIWNIAKVLNPYYSPGNVTYIPAKLEKKWLIGSSIVTAAFAVILLLRSIGVLPVIVLI